MPDTYTDGSYLTQKGNALIAKLLASKGELVYTKATIGSGLIPDGLSPEQMTDLNHYEMDGWIAAISNPVGGEVSVVVQAIGTELENGFNATEIALWANDPDEGEIVYTFLSLAQHPEWMRANGDPVLKLASFTLVTIVSAIPIVRAIINPNAFARAIDLANHNIDPNAHHALFENLKGQIQEILDLFVKVHNIDAYLGDCYLGATYLA